MAVHVAIVSPQCLARILDGRKTMESRLSATRRAPFGRVGRGDSVYFKASGGGFGAMATVGAVVTLAGLTPRGVRDVRKAHEPAVMGGAAYWHAKRGSKYGTLVTLKDVCACNRGPTYRKPGEAPSRNAWFVLDAKAATPRTPRRESHPARPQYQA